MQRNLRLTTQDTDFHNIGVTLEEALSQMSVYYSANKLRPNPTKA